MLNEVAPPGWGHTKAEKEKTKPWKPKSKIGGTAAAFKRALDDGRFKGLPGSKTKKEKTADMFKLMWSMKKKGDHPHYKPGTDKKYKKYQKNEEKQITSMQDNDLFGNAYAGTKPPKKKKKKVEESQTRYYKDDPKTKKSWKEFSVAMKKAVDQRKEYQKKNEDVRSDTKKHGVKFSDKKIGSYIHNCFLNFSDVFELDQTKPCKSIPKAC